MATIVIFGGTGYTGGNIVREALSPQSAGLSLALEAFAEPRERLHRHRSADSTLPGNAVDGSPRRGAQAAPVARPAGQ